MKLTKIKFFLFFAAIGLLLFFLYPRELFLGYIYEGQSELATSEQKYQAYLEKYPESRFATLRLAEVYKRLALPEKATPLLERLYRHRPSDWKVASAYLDHLEDINDEEPLYEARLKIAHAFLKVPHFPKAKIKVLLEDALAYALWKQKIEDVYTLGLELASISSDPQGYYYLIDDLNRGFKKTAAMIKSLQARLKKEPRHDSLRADLSSIYILQGKTAEALALLNEGLKLNPKSILLLQNRVGLYARLKKTEEAIGDIEKLLSLKLDAETALSLTKDLAGLYDKEGDFEKSLALYREVLAKENQDPQNWLVVLYLLERLEETSELMDVAEKYLALFPSDTDTINLLFAAYAQSKELKRGEKFFLSRLEQSPKNPYLLLKLAEMESLLQKRGEAKKYYSQLDDLNLHDFKTIKAIGKDLLFNGEAKKSLSYLEKAKAEKSTDPDLLFWYAEASFSQGLKGEGISASRRVVELLSKKNQLSEEESRLFLKSKGRLHFDQNTLGEYKTLEKKYPSNLDIWTDSFDLLLDAKKTKAARGEMDKMGAKFPKEKKRLKPYQVRTAFIERKWDEAALSLEAIVKEEPYAWSYHRDLAEAYRQKGEWKKAIAEYDTVYHATGDDLEVAAPLKELHATHDHRVGSVAKLTLLGSDRLLLFENSAQSFLNRDLEFKGMITAGTYQMAGGSFDHETESGRFSLATHAVRDFIFEGNLGFGFSDERRSPSLGGAIRYQIPQLVLKGSYDYRQLKTDVVAGVVQGALEDQARFEWQTFSDRLSFAGKYEFRRNYLPGGATGGGATGFEHVFEPVLTYEIFRKPSFLIGYQFTFEEFLDQNNFLALVPLVPRVRAHYLVGQLSHRFHPDWLYEAGVFVGEDTARQLHFFKGDLFGARVRLQAGLFPWLDFDGGYEYGRETLVGLVGTSHQIHVGLSGHWR